MNKARVALLIDYLTHKGRFEKNGIPRDKFDFSVFQCPTFDSGLIKRVPVGSKQYETLLKSRENSLKNNCYNVEDVTPGGLNIVTPIECHTVGCAIGWAASNPAFRKKGLTLVNTGTSTTYVYFDGELDDSAITKFFKFKEDITSNLLFYPPFYPKEEKTRISDIVKRLRYLLDNGEEKFLKRYEKFI